ncbi:unnamed protein product [Lymnaea stagnalis]|uniref:Dermatopontin n=2 Tax=Lymnaea stagnalis TaxID=6523 RepID=A0AAV2HJ49_LYMST
MSILASVVLFVAVAAAAEAAYVNQLGQPFDFKCPPGQIISHIGSDYDLLLEDRQWEFRCRAANVSEVCSSSGYVNGFGLPLAFTCPGNQVLAGVQSYHDNQVEDRRFNFRCCDLRSKAPRGCLHGSDVNTWGGKLLLEVPRGKAIKGAVSSHDVTFEDRVWKFQICDI